MAVSDFSNLTKRPETKMTVVYSHGGKHHRVMAEGYQPEAGEIVAPAHMAAGDIKQAYKNAGMKHFEDDDYVDGSEDFNKAGANIEMPRGDMKDSEKKKAAKEDDEEGVSDLNEPVVVTTNALPSDHADFEPEDAETVAAREKAGHKADHKHKKD